MLLAKQNGYHSVEKSFIKVATVSQKVKYVVHNMLLEEITLLCVAADVFYPEYIVR